MTDVGRIPLRSRDGTVRAYAIVDAADFEWLNQWRWSLAVGYAGRKESRTTNPKQRTILMHRLILGLEPGDGLQGDHANGNPLDNRRANLRAVTKAQNSQNVPARRGSTSRYRGVCLIKKGRRRWRAAVQIEYRTYIVGHYDTEEAAASAITAFRAAHMPYSIERAA